MGMCVGWGMDEPWLTMSLWLLNPGDSYSTILPTFVYVCDFPNKEAH